jgi:N-acetylglucosamine-6-phosphate deacetylase
MDPAVETIAYVNGKVLVDGQFHGDLCVISRHGQISCVQPATEEIAAGTEVIDLGGDYLVPGFIDTQVNGGGGVLFNDVPTVDGIRAIAAAHRPFGTTGLLPTLISDELDVIRQGLKAAEQAIRTAVPGVLGIHIEGPFLNEERRGVHDARKLRQLTREIVDQLEPLPNGKTLLTLAPETIHPELVTELTRKGFIVCGGHSNASQEQVKQALEHGMRGFTHLFNAMSQLTAREPGVVGQALADRTSWCGIIADGHHVSATALEIAWRCKGRDRLMLVSDAMPPVGSQDKEFFLMGKRVTVQNGICIDTDGTLAGTALDMASAVRTMVRLTQCSFADACIMASQTPAAFLGLENQLGSIRVGNRADMVVMDSSYGVRFSIIAGQGPTHA